jgi:glycosyltransferase involved in cell wall biosynthesis
MLIEFCLPIYNEEKIMEKNILELLNYLQKQDFPFFWKIILIINGSSDSSSEIADKLTTLYPQSINFINIPEPGRGQALKKYWLRSSADILCYMDIDLAVSLDNIKDLIQPLSGDNYDMAIGSRLMVGSQIKRSFIRELSSQSYNLLSRLILRHHFSDMQCGFKAIKKEVFKFIAPYVKDDKWFFDTEMIILTKIIKGKIKEVPVNWQENRYDMRQSKVNLIRDSLKFIKNLIKFRYQLLFISSQLKKHPR